MSDHDNSASPLDILAEEQIAKLKAEVAALRAMIFTSGDRSMTMEGRTFTVMGDGFIGDNNFDFDAGMRVTGDFIGDEKQQYAEMIAEVLNRHNAVVTGLAPEMLDAGEKTCDLPYCTERQVWQAMYDAAPEVKNDPVARVSGYYAGRCVVDPVNPAAVLPSGMVLWTYPPDAQAEIDQLRLKHQVACDTITRMQEERKRAHCDCVSSKQYTEASVEAANEFNEHHEQMLAEIAKRDARIAELEQTLFSRDVDCDAKTLVIAEQDAEINRLNEQAAKIARLKAVIGKCKEVLDDVHSWVGMAEGAFDIVEEALAAIKGIEHDTTD